MWIAGCAVPRQSRLREKTGNRAAKLPFDNKHVSDVADILEAMFGTPDEPYLPNLPESGLDKVIDANLLGLSAGRTMSTKNASGKDALLKHQGLFREHCVHCHGITGDGLGPTAAFLNPYPRDYRMGVFKFKSTPKGAKPTHDDLKKILFEGVAGTAMPSFKVLPSDELESLVQYVKYLAIRGEVERKLIEQIGELGRIRIASSKSRLERTKITTKRQKYEAQLGCLERDHHRP